MLMPIKRYVALHVVICLMVMAFSFSSSVKGSAENTVDPIPSNPYVRSFLGNIELKTENSIFLMERTYSVTEKTIILDEKGKVISLTKLPTPCEAVIEYQLRMDQDPLCLKIAVKKRLRKGGSMNE